tara:strand:- start:66 stop:188 length:123 start_codon:yes stop_codon:yes gene_type:complete
VFYEVMQLIMALSFLAGIILALLFTVDKININPVNLYLEK